MISFPLSAFSNKNLRELARKASHAGWRIELTNKNHVRWQPPDTDEMYVTPLTPRSNISAIKVSCFMRKHGVEDARR